MNISDCMKRNVVSITHQASVGQAAALLAQRHIGLLPVVDETGRLLGVLQLRDLLALVMPDFVRLVEDFDFVHDFGALERHTPSPEALAQPVRAVMSKPISVDENCGLLRAYALLRQNDLHDMPVVEADGRLVGIASQVDVGAALLGRWRQPGGGGEAGR